GWHDVRLRVMNSSFSWALRIAVDMPVCVECIALEGASDALTGASEIGRYVSCWVAGLPENADRHNVRLWLGEERLETMWVGAEEGGHGQVNAALPAGGGSGDLRAVCGGVESNPLAVVVR